VCGWARSRRARCTLRASLTSSKTRAWRREEVEEDKSV
jgi:hypothetical protein